MKEENNLMQSLKMIADEMKKVANENLKKYGLTWQQANILRYLKHNENFATMKEIEKIAQVSQPTALGLINRLEKKGLILTGVDYLDRRLRVISLQPKGEDLIKSIKQNMKDIETELFEHLTKEEMRILSNLLLKMQKGFQNRKGD